MIIFSKGRKNHSDRKFETRKNQVKATGNKWANENFNALNKKY